MPEEVINNNNQPAPVEANPTPVPEPIQAPVAAVSPEVTPTPAPAETAPVEAPKPAETLLGEDPNKPAPNKEAAPTNTPEAPKAEGEQPKLEGQSEEPAPPPVYDAWTLPEGITLDEALSKQFADILGQFEVNTKAEHALVQAFGQKAVDFHVSEQKKLAENIENFYKTSWEKQKIQWKDQFLADPEIGGNRSSTTVNAANEFIRTHGGTPEQQTEFRSLMENSGLGNHPAMIRLLANAARAYKEGEPLAATKPVSSPKSRISTLYGKTS